MRILAIAALASVAISSGAAANSFINGDFETVTNGAGEFDRDTQATGWTSNGYNFIVAPGTADTTGSPTSQYGVTKLWGPNNGSNNGLTDTSPSGGNFVIADGAFQTAPIEQVITGLTPGRTYSVGFDYGFGQQFGFDGDTIQRWTVSFAGQSQSTADFNVPNHGFTGWLHTSFDFIANNATETLSFLAYGNLPVPPFALLDGVTFSQEPVSNVPEPASWALLIAGFGLIGVAARRRRAAVA